MSKPLMNMSKDELSEEVIRLRAENAKPVDRVQKLNREINDVFERNTDKNDEIDRLRAENAKMEADTIAAAQRNLDLRVENDRLRAENEQLRIDKITLGNFGVLPAYRSHEEEIDRLRYESDRWKHVAENKWGIDDIAKYQEEIDSLRAENTELRRGVQLAIDAIISCADNDALLDELRAILAETAKEGE